MAREETKVTTGDRTVWQKKLLQLLPDRKVLNTYTKCDYSNRNVQIIQAGNFDYAQDQLFFKCTTRFHATK
jgi:hypothetical protein